MKAQIVMAGLAAIMLSGCATDGETVVYRPYPAPRPVYVQPAPVYVRPAPVYVEPRPVVVETGPVYGRPPYWRGPPPVNPGGPRCPPYTRFDGRRCVR
ncbi:hypothetical protein [Labrys wisconsinensis]|uniref:Lipoprotein n=1 Tax=Labrys wisconsinensis TaxID=425677 RepID=A0ABU0IYW6_9HYPH|nr:hypothetical protein [Labrys wisconsinensis]MDQ0467202.1 hypothetical protein [Labrys wisconsinensis]